MTYRVRVASGQPKIRATVLSGVIMARTVSELLDVDTSGVKDKYVIMYDANLKKYIAVNPDEVLNAAAATETTQPGLPDQFLENIPFDQGTF